MALNLDFSVVEQNDATALLIQDTTNNWGVNEIALDFGTMYLDISITTSDGTNTVYDQIDVYNDFGPFNDQSDLLYTINCANLKVSGTALGTVDDMIPDGIWNIVYNHNPFTDNEQKDKEELIHGQVRLGVYEMLRLIPITYMCEECCNSRKIKDAIFAKMYLEAMIETFALGYTHDIINQLYTLERITINGTKCTW